MQEKVWIRKSEVLFGKCEELLPFYYDDQVDLIFTSPPYYNQRGVGDYSSVEEYLAKIWITLELCKKVMKPGAIFALNVGGGVEMDYKSELSVMLRQVGFQYIDTICWQRGSGNVVRGFHINAGNIYYPFLSWEAIFIYRKPKKEHGFGIVSGEDFPRFENRFQDYISNNLRTNVWNIPQDSVDWHPAAFPVRLAYSIIACYSERDSVILDPYSGSMTTAVAAEQIGNRTYIMIEANSEFYEKGLERLKATNMELQL